MRTWMVRNRALRLLCALPACRVVSLPDGCAHARVSGLFAATGWPHTVVGATVSEQREGLRAVLSDVGGEPGGVVIGQEATAHAVDERAVDAHKRVRSHIRAHVSGRPTGPGGEPGGQCA